MSSERIKPIEVDQQRKLKSFATNISPFFTSQAKKHN